MSKEDRPLFAALVAIAFALFLSFLAAPFPHSEPANAQPQKEEQWDTPLSGLWDWLAKDSISLFTGVLALLTGCMVYYNGRQILLAREEFSATHRPQIRIRHIWVRTIQPDQPISVDIVYANVGNAKAVVTSFGLDFNIIDPNGQLPGDLNTAKPIPAENAECGLGQTIRKDDVRSAGTLDLARYTQVMNGQKKLYCFGIIEYSDAGPASIRKIKRSAFCMKFRKAAEGEGMGRFVRFETPDPDYEYED